MITAAALVPHPPLLFRELGGAADPVAALRAAALRAVRDVTRDAELVVVAGPAAATGRWDADAPVDVHGFGTTGRSVTHQALPLSLGVGVRLLREGGWDGPLELHGLDGAAGTTELDRLVATVADRPGRSALLALGDGSARRGEKAPGHLDERAFAFDDALARALADGDAAGLAGLDTGLADELMVLGAPAFRLLGLLGLRQPPARAALSYRDDPFGVSYFVACWAFR